MDKKIQALRAAYLAQDAARVLKASKAIVAYDRAHPFCACLPDIAAAVKLAQRIVDLIQA